MSMFLESIGGLALVGLFIYFIFRYVENKEHSDKVNSELIDHSPKCVNLRSKNYDRKSRGKPHLSDSEIERMSRKIIKDPKEKEEAISLAESERKNLAEYKRKEKADERRKRKVGYKYEIEVFEIFDRNRELTKSQIVEGIIEKYSIDNDKAHEIFDLWIENWLISDSIWESGFYEIGFILNSELVNLDDDDWTWDKWLSKNNITLLPISKKAQAFYDEMDDVYDF